MMAPQSLHLLGAKPTQQIWRSPAVHSLHPQRHAAEHEGRGTRVGLENTRGAAPPNRTRFSTRRKLTGPGEGPPNRRTRAAFFKGETPRSASSPPALATPRQTQESVATSTHPPKPRASRTRCHPHLQLYGARHPRGGRWGCLLTTPAAATAKTKLQLAQTCPLNPGSVRVCVSPAQHVARRRAPPARAGGRQHRPARVRGRGARRLPHARLQGLLVPEGAGAVLIHASNAGRVGAQFPRVCA